MTRTNDTDKYEEIIVYVDELPDDVSLLDVVKEGLKHFNLEEWIAGLELDHRDTHYK